MYESEILAIYKFSGINSFPVELESIVASIGYSLKTYQEVAKTKDKMIEMKKISGDAYTDRGRKIIYYNDSTAIPIGRKRFSIAHEIGHITLLTDDEEIANEYASNLLAPRPIIFARQLRTSTQISRAFRVTISAANNSLISPMYVPDESGFEIIDYFRERSSCPWPYNTKDTIQFTSLPWEAAPAPDPAPAPAPVKTEPKKPVRAAEPVITTDDTPNPERDKRIKALREYNLRQIKKGQIKMRKREEFMDSLPESVRRKYTQRSFW